MPQDIYAQHQAAFSRVSAYVIMKDGQKVATVAFKFPADGAGRLYAYAHWLGMEMCRGSANGYGYDKRSAACADAARKAIKAFKPDENDNENPFPRASFFRILSEDDGNEWHNALERAGFAVLQAV